MTDPVTSRSMPAPPNPNSLIQVHIYNSNTSYSFLFSEISSIAWI
jgi:hypothetical protein